jgi:sigma-B regulation protein RsbU (phosphoserine phosphatase)
LAKTSTYSSNIIEPLTAGQIILVGTDGIWETRNLNGEMFGKEAVRKIIRRHHSSGAGAIRSAIIEELTRFRQHQLPEDDITLVVVKILGTGKNQF